MANFHGLLLLCLALLMAVTAAATQFKVGGSKGSWTVPTDPNAMSYNQWAERSRFRIGDSILFVYPPDQDSVLQVDKEAYSNCNTSSYIQRFDDGNTVFTFDRSGAFYFISGVRENCVKSESVTVVVLADRSNHSMGSNPPSSPPSPSPTSSSPPPTSQGSNQPSSPPSPPPASSSPPPSEVSSSPPPPPSGSMEVTPSSAPAGGESSPPPPNGASAKVMGFMGFVGAFVGPLLFAF